tara:strand:- start:225 stop:521 length:297 start_codon:yes stop_codon:yes gene_type:complete
MIKILQFVGYFIYYSFILAIFFCLLLAMKKYIAETKMILTVSLTIYIIYYLTTPRSQKKTWIQADEVSHGPPLQLYYPTNPLVLKNKKKTDLNVQIVI